MLKLSNLILTKNALHTSPSYLFSRNITKQTNSRIPYKFGGVPAQPSNPVQEMMIKRAFGDHVIDGFKQAYLSSLSAIREKDSEFLKNIMEGGLTENIEYPSC